MKTLPYTFVLSLANLDQWKSEFICEIRNTQIRCTLDQNYSTSVNNILIVFEEVYFTLKV